MRAEDTVCRTCGAEYKASYIFLIIVFILIVIAVSWGAWWYFSQKQMEKENLLKSNIAAYVEVLRKLDLPTGELEKIANLKYSDDIKPNKFAFAELKELVASFNDQRDLTNKVMRVELVQPLSELQKIKRTTEAKKYTGCLEASKLIYVSSMSSTNEALLTFLADGSNKGDEITHLFTKSIIQEQEAKKVLDECEIKSAQ